MNSKKKKYFWLILLATFLPSSSLASTISINTKDKIVFVGDTVVFDVVLNSDNKDINAIDGNIDLNYNKESISINELSVAGSGFSLWPRKPSLSVDHKSIMFVGGIPGSIKSDDLLVFKMIVKFKDPGVFSIDSDDMSVFLADGNGTKDVVDFEKFSINILPKLNNSIPRDEWAEIVSKDNIPPLSFDIFEGRDESMSDNKRFLSFNTVDKESGIAFFEVKEGNLEPVRSGGVYVLQQQDKNNKIVVTAFDFANNIRVSVYNPRGYDLTTIVLLVITLIFLFIIIKRR